MLTLALLLLLGFVLLGVGAELLVHGSSTLALRLGMSPLLVGLTIVAFGTSAPEMAVSIQSATNGTSALALGNVIGSNIANIGLVLGITALISPITIEQQLIRKQIPLVIASSMLMWFLLSDGDLVFLEGVLLVSCLLAFLAHSYQQSKAEPFDAEESTEEFDVDSGYRNLLPKLMFIVVGMILLVSGSTVFVDAAVTLAQEIGISEAVIGLTIVAIGTSIPELATAVVAAVRNHADLAVGNIIGSNLFNILGILGITALISPISAAQFNPLDFTIMILFTLVLLPMAWTNLTLSRIEGLFLLSGYAVYLLYVSQQIQ